MELIIMNYNVEDKRLRHSNYNKGGWALSNRQKRRQTRAATGALRYVPLCVGGCGAHVCGRADAAVGLLGRRVSAQSLKATFISMKRYCVSLGFYLMALIARLELLCSIHF